MTEDEYVKLGVIGALNLYLDFLNIFLYLLRLFSSSSRDKWGLLRPLGGRCQQALWASHRTLEKWVRW